MTVTLITKKKEFMGLSSDTKPTDGVYIGSTFHESDTGLQYIYDGDIWTEDLRMAKAIDLALNTE